ncbi:MAG: two-component system, sensor histidine kinase and response regulator [Gemmatimonadales bacterium]|jgi:signal transduction histidine kinase|nr:two-component system, sensor histidine kinase and response regulator [Gemmatimonadales bacterium]
MNEAVSGPHPATPESARILVVDDEPRNVQLLQDLLESRGYTVWTAADGEQGLALARDRSPDVVLLDIMMPRLSGFDVCRQLKGDPGTAMIPVLLVTSLDAREDRLAGMRAGANDFITKPIDTGDLLLRVQNAATTKRLHDEVTRQFRQLQELEAARDTLTHMIVHDLRSPLTGLQAYLDLLRLAVAAGATDEVLEYARDASAVSGRLKDMVSQVLDVSRLEGGHMPIAREEADLAQLLPAAAASLGPPPGGVRIVYLLPGTPLVVPCDRDLVSRVLINLVGNAFKFTPRNSEIRIGLEADNGYVRFTVTDAGPGVAPEHREMIFEKFAQAPLGRMGVLRSTGLGLTFCKLAIGAHGGRIGVDSGDGGGARFWVELPAGIAG